MPHKQLKQSGFTLIELVSVLVILGIIAAVAVPKFINLTDEARQIQTNVIAKSIESASSLNHAVDIANEAGLSSDLPIAVANCTDGFSLLADGQPLDAGGSALYTIGSVAVGNKASATCTLTRAVSDQDDSSADETATFRIIGAVQ